MLQLVGCDAMDVALSDVVSNRSWRREELPFQHVVATDVLARAVYLDLVAAFESCLAADAEEGFRRDMRGFDATGHNFAPPVPAPFDIFFSRSWHDLLTGLFGVTGTGHLSGGLHHHHPGSRSGGVHNDLNPGWFSEAGSADAAVVVADRRRCDYGTGQVHEPDVSPVETVRAVAMIYYLANPSWTTGDGGETGLYRYATDDPERPAVTVPPRNNSLLAFECTPFSYHAFLSNRRTARNSLVLWAHRPKPEVVARWDDRVIVPWAR